jgi:hypothetical protein
VCINIADSPRSLSLFLFNKDYYFFRFLLNFSQVDQEIEEVNVRSKEQTIINQQLKDEIDKFKSLGSKEMKLVDQQTQQNDRLNEEIRNVENLTVFEEAKLARGQIDE